MLSVSWLPACSPYRLNNNLSWADRVFPVVQAAFLRAPKHRVPPDWGRLGGSPSERGHRQAPHQWKLEPQ